MVVFSNWFRGLQHNVLSMKGFHFLATRFGGASLRRLSFDAKFQTGAWNYAGDEMLAKVVMHYGRQRKLLIMGCGVAGILANAGIAAFSSILGIDISGEAIRLAGGYESPRARFRQADMATFHPDETYDVILFPESIYYVPFWRRRRLLRSLSCSLTPGGCFVITIAHPLKYAGLLRMIRRNFTVMEDRHFEGSTRHLIVFGPETK